MSKYFRLFENCIPVKGARRAVICDLQLGRFTTISHSLYEVLNYLKKFSIESFEKNNPKEAVENIKYLNELELLGLGHFTDDPNKFTKLELSFQSPFKINDSIIELSDITFQRFETIIKSLNNLGCQTLELRAYEHFSLKKVEVILKYLEFTRVRNVEIYLRYSGKVKHAAYKRLLDRYQVIGSLVVHSNPQSIQSMSNYPHLYFTREKLVSNKCCGNINQNYFKVNLPMFTESLKFNSCLNRKISIDKNGLIKNCPSFSNNYGSIKSISLESVYSKKTFKALWTINKSEIKVCRDCEFRFICTDCRAFVEDPKDVLSKPLKCGYNPYTTEWSRYNDLSEKQIGIVAYGLERY